MTKPSDEPKWNAEDASKAQREINVARGLAYAALSSDDRWKYRLMARQAIEDLGIT